MKKISSNTIEENESAGKKRTRIEVISDILRVILEKKGSIKPTHLMYKANLSHKSLNLYTSQLIKSQLIIKTQNQKDNKNMFEITPKGMAFYKQYSQVREFEKTFGL
jgi:predicted transcriptional regulator